ncbi:MAG TPA: 16S rRNA pseudouridine(516) synthase RsuA [Spongiibacteraceae bacterium]|nr:16S rRNA pseudouridine(516) synthase RsuA [Spongiibacteraceae bacterium]
MRLDKFIANVTDLSRSDAKRFIKARLVNVAGQTIEDPQYEVDAAADVTLEGRALRRALPRYFMLHKPDGYVCATKDRKHSTVLDLLHEDNREALHIVGRLDIDTTGLVLLTDDGQWSHRVTAPKSDCDKTYLLQTAEPIVPQLVEQFARGLFLLAEKQRLKPAQLEIIDALNARLTISEGKYHQVKRMFGAVGNAVVRLHRERIGAIVLDPTLAEGEYRSLTAEEVASVT